MLRLVLVATVLSTSSQPCFSRRLSQTQGHYQEGLEKRQNHRRDEGCPAVYPKNAAFNLTEEFMVNKVKVVMELSDMVNREEYGDIEDLVEDQRNIFERFDGFSDYNDQSLVAKTKDTNICFATFQSTDPGNGIFAFLLGA